MRDGVAASVDGGGRLGGAMELLYPKLKQSAIIVIINSSAGAKCLRDGLVHLCSSFRASAVKTSSK